MPKDEWAKARAKDKARSKVRGKFRSNLLKSRQSWLEAIVNAVNAAELTMVARSIAAKHDAGKMSDRQYRFLVNAGKHKRSQL